MNTGKMLFAQLMDFLPWTIYPYRQATWWQPLREIAGMYRSIPRDGFCATDLPRESARY